MAKNDIITWDTTDANNTDISGIPVTNATLIAQLDDIVRGQMGATARLTNTETIASSSTTNIAALAGQYVNVTGTTTITALGTVRTGIIKFVKFAAALTLTHNATSLILPTSANITTAAGDMAVLVSEGSGNWRCLSYSKADGTAVSVAVAAPPQGYLYGLTLSNNATDAINDIDIAVGEAASDVSPSVLMSLASILTKRLDAAWAVGTNQGGLDTGAIANTTYHIWLIRRPDTGVIDALFSASATAPTMPASYTQKRRIGSVLRESAAIVSFTQSGDTFVRNTPISDLSSTNPGATAATRTLSVPTGVKIQAVVTASIVDGNLSASPIFVYLSDLAQSDVAASVSNAMASSGGTSTTTSAGSSVNRIFTNTSAQIRSRVSASFASTVLTIGTHGWVDPRGRV